MSSDQFLQSIIRSLFSQYKKVNCIMWISQKIMWWTIRKEVQLCSTIWEKDVLLTSLFLIDFYEVYNLLPSLWRISKRTIHSNSLTIKNFLKKYAWPKDRVKELMCLTMSKRPVTMMKKQTSKKCPFMN